MEIEKRRVEESWNGIPVPAIAIYVNGRELLKVSTPKGSQAQSVMQLLAIYSDLAESKGRLSLSDDFFGHLAAVLGKKPEELSDLPLPVIGAVISAVFELAEPFLLQLGDISRRG